MTASRWEGRTSGTNDLFQIDIENGNGPSAFGFRTVRSTAEARTCCGQNGEKGSINEKAPSAARAPRLCDQDAEKSFEELVLSTGASEPTAPNPGCSHH